MAKKPAPQSLTSTEFSKRTGIPVQTLGRLIREGKIKGHKQSGRWVIDAGELNAKAVAELAKGSAPVKAAKKPVGSTAAGSASKAAAKPAPAVAPKTGGYSVSEFSALTYLTDYGVVQYLRKGVLTGRQDKDGNWQVDADNLENPGIRHLVR